MPVQVKDLHSTIPYGLILKGLCYRDRLDPGGVTVVEITDCLLEGYVQLY